MKATRLFINACACAGVWFGIANTSARAETSTYLHQTPGASAAAPSSASIKQSGQLRMNFHRATLDDILDYLSDAAGLIIQKEDDLKPTLDVISQKLLTSDEAVQLLNAALKKSGGAVSRDGRILTVVRLDLAKTSDLDVVTGSDPAAVEKSDQVITQIIPVHYANASQLLNNLQVLLPGTATISANESANALILVATKTQVRRMLRIVAAIDTSMARVSSVKILPLRYADAKQLASAIQQLFPAQTSSQTSRSSGGFNSPGGFGPPGFGGPTGGGSDSAATGSTGSGAKVTAVAEEQSNSLILSAPSESMAVIVHMVREIDQPVADITEIRVFTLKNADPTELADQLSQLFPENNNSSRASDQNQSPVQFGGGPPGGGGAGGGPGGFGGGPPGGPGGSFGGTDASETSTRSKKRGTVISVPDARTSSLVVTAASALMPQIARLVEALDASSARKEVVQVYELHHADPQDINSALQDLFHRNSSTGNNNNSDRTSLLGQGNPLTTRQTQQQNSSTSSSTGFGNSSGQGGGGAGGGGQ